MNTMFFNPHGEVWGYARVSTAQQKIDRQVDAIVDYGVPEHRIFIDYQSGKDFNRPAYRKLIRVLRKGDILIIKSIDRLGRNYTEIIEQFRIITQDIGCGIHVIDMPMLNTSGDHMDLMNRFVSDLILQVLSFVSENEREQTLKRQREGIEAAKRRRKVKIGRPKKRMPFDFWAIYFMWKTGEFKTNDLWRYCHETWGMSNRTFYRRIYELDSRFGSLNPNRLKDLILDAGFYDGIPFDNERLEQGIGYYNPYVLHNPEKERRELEKRKQREAELTEDDILAAENELKRKMLEKRKKDFQNYFQIADDELAHYTIPGKRRYNEEDLPKKLIYKKQIKGGFSKVANGHKQNSGIEDAIDLLPDLTQIPDIPERPADVKPTRTIIVM